jgi:hypothetical protein
MAFSEQLNDINRFINKDVKIKTYPFLHAVADNFFAPEIYDSLKEEFNRVLKKGLSENYSSDKFYRFSHYDAYCYIPHQQSPQDPFGVRSFFYSAKWKEFVSNIFSRNDLSNDVLLEYHYHKPFGNAGEIHSDNEAVNFPIICEKSKEFINLFDSNMRSFDNSVNYRGSCSEKTILRKRSIVAILYLNDYWKEGDGGETALYEDPNKDPVSLIKPKGNSILLFEISENSWHRSLQLNNRDRKTICFWFHI